MCWMGFGDAPVPWLHPKEDRGHLSRLRGWLGVPTPAWGRGSTGPGGPTPTHIFPREGILGLCSATWDPQLARGALGCRDGAPTQGSTPSGVPGMGGWWGTYCPCEMNGFLQMLSQPKRPNGSFNRKFSSHTDRSLSGLFKVIAGVCGRAGN